MMVAVEGRRGVVTRGNTSANTKEPHPYGARVARD